MTDLDLDALRSDPPTPFAEALRTRLASADAPASGRRRWHPASFAVPAAAVFIGAVLLGVPQVRAAAASLLARFRVVNFVAVPVDPARFDALGSDHLDLGDLIGSHVDMLENGAPVPVRSTAEAGALAGLDVHLPAWLPADSRIIEVAVTPTHVARVTGDVPRLREVLELLGITDEPVPESLNGATATISAPPVVMVRYEHGGSGGRHTRFFESLQPEITLPADVDPVRLGEIGLRILGLAPDAARQFAQSIDWTNTLIVPIPPTARQFRQVEISGHPGVQIGYQPPNASFTTMVLWSDGTRVYGLQSIQAAGEVMDMANSIP